MREVALVMPKMSMTMAEGTLVTWHKAPGDRISHGDVVCEVATDKVDMEVEANVDGTLARLVAEPDQVVTVGDPIAYIATTSDDLLDGLLDGPPQPAPAPQVILKKPDEPVVANGWPSAVPLARTRARELDVDLAEVTPTGPNATVRVIDVENAASLRPETTQEPIAVTPETRQRPDIGSRARTAVARRMTAAAAVPQFTVYRDINLDTAGSRRQGCGWTTLFTHAFAHALRAHPSLNATWTGDGVDRHDHVAVALAVDTDRGLVAPTLRDPDLMTTIELDRRLKALVARARDGKLAVADTFPATTTVSNLGALGVHSFNALLTPPQSTALSMGAVAPQVVPAGDGIGVRTRCRIGLTVDHRVADGADAARLLATVQALLEPGNDL